MIKLSKALFILLTVWTAIIALSGCQGDNQNGRFHSQTVAVEKPDDSNLKPIKVVCMIDKTLSSKETRTEPCGQDTFKPLLAALCKSGGEAAFGIISDTSNSTFLRIRILPSPPKPQMPEQKDNAFIVARLMEDYRAKKAIYQNEYQKWQASADAEVQEFMPKLEELIAQPATYRKTEIYEALRRATLFLTEPDMAFPESLPRHIVFISDCIHDASSAAPMKHLNINAKLVIANGSGSVGSISALNPICFESVSSALRFVIQDSQK